MLNASAGAILVTTLPLAFLALGAEGMSTVACDAFSAPYCGLLMVAAVMLWLAAVLPRRFSFIHAGLLVAAAGGAMLLALAVLFPACLAGPYWMIDPLAERYWFDRITQENDVLYAVAAGNPSMAVLAGLLVLILVFALPIVISRLHGQPALAILLAMALTALVMMLVVTRYHRLADGFVPPFLLLAYRFVTDGGGVGEVYGRVMRRAFPFVAGATCVATAATIIFRPASPLAFDAVGVMSMTRCEAGDHSVLSTLPAGRIIAPMGLSTRLLSDLPAGFSVAAAPFHRASPGMLRVYEAFLASDTAIRTAALAPFDYVAICRSEFRAEGQVAPLYEALASGRDWPGLARLPTGEGNPLQIFAIDHGKLK